MPRVRDLVNRQRFCYCGATPRIPIREYFPAKRIGTRAGLDERIVARADTRESPMPARARPGSAKGSSSE